VQISRHSFTLLAGAAASALILSACGGGSSTPAPQAQAALTVAAASTTLDPSGTTVLSSSGGNGTGATTYNATGACTVSGTTVTAASTGGACTVTATKAADSTYLAITSSALTVTVRAAQAAFTVAAVATSLDRSGTTTLSSSGGSGTGATTYSATGACTVSGTTLTAPSTASTCTVTATKAADANYSAITSTAISVKVYAGTALVTVNQQAIVGSGTAANYGNYANDYTGNGANGWLTDGGATANYYKDDSAGITWMGWYFGQSSPGDHPNYVAVLGLKYSGTAPWGMGYFVKAPSNGNARMLGYQNINLEFWSPAANVGTNPTVSIFLNAPAITHNGSSCVPSLKGMATIPTAAGTLTTIALSSLTLDKACGYASGTEVLQAGINEIHLQLLSANNSLNIAGAQGGGAANSLNVGRILFN